jgi:hypothetical protein
MEGRFSKRADELIARARCLEISPSTEFSLICECVDAWGNQLPPVYVPILPSRERTGRGDPATQLTCAVDLETIIDAIDSLVRYVSEGLVTLQNGPNYPVEVREIDLSIDRRSFAEEGSDGAEWLENAHYLGS